MKEIAKQMFDAALAIAPGLKNIGHETVAELKRLGTQGSMEWASLQHTGSAFVPYGPGQYSVSTLDFNHDYGMDSQLAPVMDYGMNHAMEQSHELEHAMERER